MNDHLQTTVIGSYPIAIDTMEVMNAYFQQQDLSWHKYISQAVQDMVHAGIDLVSDGQTRDPFVQIFTRKLRGCRIRDRTEVIGTVEHDGPITVEDQKYVRSLLPKTTKIVGILTGPYTLTKSCVDLHYHNERDLAFDFAQALKCEAQLLQHHVDMISIDEPFFAVSYPGYGVELIEMITRDLSCPTRLHACGDVTAVVPHLLEMPVDVLSHEFKATPQILDEFCKYSFPQNICLGVSLSDNERIEPVTEIIKQITNANNILNGKITQIAPDCGQKLLPRDIAFQKLKHIAMAGKTFHG
jgi:5-methyltetrahydropteroyltriglutamate--homocysteine methyltransferase